MSDKPCCRICFPVIGTLSAVGAASFLVDWYDETTIEWCSRLCASHSVEVAAELLKLEGKEAVTAEQAGCTPC